MRALQTLAAYSKKLGWHLLTLIAGSTSQRFPVVQGEGWGSQGESVSHGSCFGYPIETEDRVVK